MWEKLVDDARYGARSVYKLSLLSFLDEGRSIIEACPGDVIQRTIENYASHCFFFRSGRVANAPVEFQMFKGGFD